MTKKKLNLKNLIYDNRFVLILSVVAAIIIWMVVAIQASPEDDRVIKDVPVKIEMSNTVSNLGLQMFGNTEFTVDVKVHGKRYEVAESVLTKDDITVVAKTNYVDSTGSQTLKLEVSPTDPDNANYEILSMSQDTVNVYFDYYKEGEYTLSPDLIYDYDGSSYVADGLTGDTPVLSANTVKLSGPATEMNKIQKVVARVTLEKPLSATATLETEILPLSEYGGKLQYITVNDGIADITMTLFVYQQAELPTTVTFKNAPASYVSAPPTFSCDPAKVKVLMDAATLSSLSELSVADIDFYQLKAGENKITVDLTKLTGIKQVTSGETKLTVTVNMSGVTDKTSTVDAENISFINVPNGYKAVVTQSEIKSVEVIGPKSSLDKITADQLFAEVDLANVDPSATHGTVLARAYVKGSTNCWVYGRYKVSYRLEKVD